MRRILIFAAFGWVFLAGAHPIANEANTHGRTEKAQRSPAPTAEPVWRAYADPYSERCYQARDHESADLCAQWRTAISSERAAHEARRATNWAIVATLLSLIGVGGLIYTLWQTQGALREARRSNQIAITAAERQLRAYLSVRKAMAMGINDKRLPTFGIEIKNQGQTPAYDVSICSATLWTTESPEHAIIHFTEPSKMGTMSGGDDRTYRSRTAENAWPPGLYQAVMSGQAVLVYSGVITYRDIFRKVRRTTFMGYLEAHDIVDGSAILSLTKRGNRSS